MKTILFYLALPPSFLSCVQQLPQIVRKEKETSHIVAARLTHKHTSTMHVEHYEADADIGKIKTKNFVVYMRGARAPWLGASRFSRRSRSNDKDGEPLKGEPVVRGAIINQGLTEQALALMSTDRFVRATNLVQSYSIYLPDKSICHLWCVLNKKMIFRGLPN